MHIDLVAIQTMLRVNKLTAESPDADIRKMLTVAGYTESEVVETLRLLREKPGTASKNSHIAPYISSISSNTPYTSIAPPTPSTLSRLHKILGIVLVVLLYGALALNAHNFMFALSFLYGTISNGFDVYLAAFLAGGIASCFFIFVLAYFIARTLYWSQSYALWLVLHVSVTVILWSILTLGILHLSVFPVPMLDWMSPAISVMAGIIYLLATISVLVVSVVALFTSVRSWKTKSVYEGVVTNILTTILAISALVYVSNVLMYPAKSLHIKPLCYGIASETDRTNCLTDLGGE